MAKRKRLEVPSGSFSPDLGTKQAFAPKVRMPIAEVAGEVAGRAALEEVAREMTAAEKEGRVIKQLPIDKISVHHLCRDRMSLDRDEMEALKASIASRGQQTPIEVVHLGGTYGLISGMRRVLALRELERAHVLALVRCPESAEAAYQAMVEENEVRANLSFYERANIAVAAVEQGVYGTHRKAVAGLFAHSSAPKRSKIMKFVTICETLGRTLTFPTAIPEKLGLRLAAAIETDRQIAKRISEALRKAPPSDAAAERRVIERSLKGNTEPLTTIDEVAPGILMQARNGRVVFSGSNVDEKFLQEVRAWAVSHAKTIDVVL